MNPQQLSQLENTINSDYRNIVGMVILKDGKMLYENYFNECRADTQIHISSVTKSIISLLIGIAIDKGLIKSVGQRVLDFFPDYTVTRGEKTIQSVTLKDMLTMTTPYKYKSAPYTKYFSSDDWVKSALGLLGGKGSIGEFRYASLIGPDILYGILVNATGQSVLDFARENLFLPLGIEVNSNITFSNKEEYLAFLNAKNISGWIADPRGVNTAAWGLTLTATDMAKIGQLCIDGGLCNGEQIVSTGWLAESTKEHSRWEQLNRPYGYLWWVINEHTYSAMGDGGNAIYINTKNKMVVSIASLFKPRVKDRIELIKEQIEPLFEHGV